MSLDHTLSRPRALRAIRLRRPPLRLLAAVVLAAALLGGGWMLVRDSSLVQVREVRVLGASSSAAPRIRDALASAARGMTTLHVRDDVLQRAVAGFPSVAALRVQTGFPHRLTVEVLERRPVAALAVGDQLLAATGGGLLLRDVAAPDGVPEIRIAAAPAGARVTDPRVLGALAVAAAAPPALRRRATAIVWGPRGLSAQLESGPPLIFGASTEAAAKWVAAARVLAEPSAAGATYLDLRVPGRVAAGGLGPVAAAAPADPATGVVATPTATVSPQPQP